MADYDRIRAVKKAALGRLMAIPGVHSVAIGAKVVAGKRTTEPSIAVFVVKKKKLSEIPPNELIPSEIDGIKTDVVEEEKPELFAGTLPDTTQYPAMEGGIQIQAGTSVTGLGTLGCIASTTDPDDPKIVAITCQHVVALWGPAIGLKVYSAPTQNQITLYGSNIAGSTVSVSGTVQPSGGGAQTPLGPFSVVTTNADTPISIASNLAGQITQANSNVTATATAVVLNTGPGACLQFTPAAGFAATLDCSAEILLVTHTNKVITFSGPNPGGMLVQVQIVIVPPTGNFKYLDFFYTTTPGDTLNAIANAVAGTINGLADPADVTAAGPAQPNGSEVTITSGTNGPAAFLEASAFSPMEADPDSKLKAAVTPPTGPDPDYLITISGQVDGENYGIYVNVNPAGQSPSYGIFVTAGQGEDPADIAGEIAGSLGAQNIPNVTVSNTGAQITISGVEEVECIIASDVRVGQPVRGTHSRCSKCCDRWIGEVLNASLLLDAALIQLDTGVQYKAEAVGIPGAISGEYAVTDDDANSGFAVQKSGRTTGVTNGTVDYLNADGVIGGGDVFHRRYTNAMKITGASGKFSDHGDSGAAVLTTTSPLNVVGILFGGGSGTALATPIQAITDGLDLQIQTADGTVSDTTADAMSGPVAAAAAVRARNVNRLAVHWDRLREAEAELTNVPAGNEIAVAVRRHIPETQRLINNNRRFAAIWQRYGGSQILQAILRMPQFRDQRLPSTIEGRPLFDCLKKIEQVLLRYASPQLSRDLLRYESFIVSSLNLTYSELLAALQSARVD